MASLADNRRNARKKICVVNVFYSPQTIGGATRVVVDNIGGLQQRFANEYKFVVFTTDACDSGAYRLHVSPTNGIRVYRAGCQFRENMDWHFEDDEMFVLFGQFLDFEKPDLVHFHCVQRLSASVLEAAFTRRIKYIVTVHDAWWISDLQFLVDQNGVVYPEGHHNQPMRVLSLPHNVSMQQSVTRRKKLIGLLNRAESVLVVSESFADIYRSNGVEGVVVVENGISTALNWQSKSTGKNQKVICAHIGGRSPHKGYDLLKNCIYWVQPENLEFLVVDHSREYTYEGIAYWGRVKVTFIGRVQQEKMPEFYAKTDVLFAPSIWPESYGLVSREALKTGCWVVASDVGAIAEDIVENENGHIVKANDHRALDAVLQKIDNDYEKYKSLSKTGKVRTSYEQVEELSEIYRSLTV